MIEELDQSKEQEKHSDQEKHKMLRHADAPGGTFAADHKNCKEQREPDDADGVKPSQ